MACAAARPSGPGEAAQTCKQPANPAVEGCGAGCRSVLPACTATARSTGQVAGFTRSYWAGQPASDLLSHCRRRAHDVHARIAEG